MDVSSTAADGHFRFRCYRRVTADSKLLTKPVITRLAQAAVHFPSGGSLQLRWIQTRYSTTITIKILGVSSRELQINILRHLTVRTYRGVLQLHTNIAKIIYYSWTRGGMNCSKDFPAFLPFRKVFDFLISLPRSDSAATTTTDWLVGSFSASDVFGFKANLNKLWQTNTLRLPEWHTNGSSRSDSAEYLVCQGTVFCVKQQITQSVWRGLRCEIRIDDDDYVSDWQFRWRLTLGPVGMTIVTVLGRHWSRNTGHTAYHTVLLISSK